MLFQTIARPVFPSSSSAVDKKKKRLAKRVGVVSLSCVAALTSYLIIWGIAYRQPHTSPSIIDLRTDSNEKPYYVAICSGLASNKHGFPGHCYVIWSDSLPCDLNSVYAAGYVPKNPYDQIPSLWQFVPGMVVTEATHGNLRNFDAAVAIVDRQTFQRSKKYSQCFTGNKFKVGTNDCVAFANGIASDIGLAVPDSRYKYPQDYVAELKKLNTKSCGVKLNFERCYLRVCI